LWPGDLPSGSDWERGLAEVTTIYEAEGRDGLRTLVHQMPGYRDERS
jgi:hypothetical protein